MALVPGHAHARCRLRVRVLRRGRTRARARCRGRGREPVRARSRRARRPRARPLRQSAPPLAGGRRQLRAGVGIRDARAPSARGRSDSAARTAPGHVGLSRGDDPVVRPQRVRPRRLVRGQGQDSNASTTTRRSVPTTRARFPTRTCTATSTVGRSRGTSRSRRSHGGRSVSPTRDSFVAASSRNGSIRTSPGAG